MKVVVTSPLPRYCDIPASVQFGISDNAAPHYLHLR